MVLKNAVVKQNFGNRWRTYPKMVERRWTSHVTRSRQEALFPYTPIILIFPSSPKLCQPLAWTMPLRIQMFTRLYDWCPVIFKIFFVYRVYLILLFPDFEGVCFSWKETETRMARDVQWCLQWNAWSYHVSITKMVIIMLITIVCLYISNNLNTM